MVHVKERFDLSLGGDGIVEPRPAGLGIAQHVPGLHQMCAGGAERNIRQKAVNLAGSRLGLLGQTTIQDEATDLTGMGDGECQCERDRQAGGEHIHFSVCQGIDDG